MRLLLGLLITLLFTGAATAQGPRVKWGTKPQPLPQPITISEKKVDGKNDDTVIFPDKAKTIHLGSDQIAAVSDDGRLVLIYNWKKREASVFDKAGIRKSQFQTDKIFGRIKISISGLIVMYFSQEENDVYHPSIGGPTDFRLYSLTGKLLYRLDGRLITERSIHTKFSSTV